MIKSSYIKLGTELFGVFGYKEKALGSVSAANMLAVFFLVVLSCVRSGSARDSLITGNWICDDGSTLVSMDGTFELGFFSPPVGSSSNRRYLGIWYHPLKDNTVVWVANRNQPLRANVTSTCFGIRSNGTLMAWDGKQELLFFPSENTSVRVVQLMNSGNLVFRVNETGEILWESFHDPTDTFLPGMKMNETLNLTSWISPADPAPGNYVFKQEKLENEDWVTIYHNSSNVYWRAETSWHLPHYMNVFLHNLSNTSNPNSTETYSRLVLDFTGEMRYVTWDKGKEKWSASWWAKGDRCSTVDNVCGKFGTCNANNAFMCKCLPGFVPLEPEKWKVGDFAGGCEKSPGCGHSFLNLKMIKVRKYDREIPVKDEKNCRAECSNNCSCIAYAGVRMVDRAGGSTRPKCWTWSEDLPSLQEEDRDGYNLFVRVHKSEIESTTRNCETCGTNVIPYPLSTGRNCGDSKYSNFSCDNDTGQVCFKVNNNSYRVSDIEPRRSKFVIQVKNDNFSSPMNITQSLKLKPPFNMTRLCNPSKTDELIRCHSEMTLNDSFEMEISWDPPAEPECTSWEDCKDWPHSNCTKRGKVRKCFCKKNFRWDGQSLNCTQESGNQQLPLNIVVGISVAIALVAISSTLGYIAYLFHRTNTKRAEKRANRGRHLYDNEKRMKHLIDSEQFKEEDKKEIDIPFFDLEEILAATDDFSDANKLGQGGFGPVYKGKLPEGPEIAIKRLSKASGQGLQEFKNEVVLIAKLQHRNLVKLLGYCIEGDEKILLYEYMRNKSLDTFIFDRTLCILLNWGKRFDIILGIARGLLYLHQDSRLKIIHRDLKISNILLDDDMNPKISDFGLARIFDSKQVQASTSRIIGTYGYMSPEYALDGYFSEKSDVFSFGVMILEIISGKRNTGFYQSDQALSLLGHAWKLWKEGKAVDLMDQTLTESCNGEEFSRCVNVGLLCVQEDPGDRPTMANAVLMLSSDVATMPVPKEPAFIVKSRGFSSTASSSGKVEEASWKNDLLAPIGEGR